MKIARRLMSSLSPRTRRVRHAVAEAMESRLLMSTNSWKSAVSGDWDTAANWSAGHVPTSAEDVSISVAGTYTVTHMLSNADSCHSITSSKPLTFSAGTLTVATTLTTTAAFTLSGGNLVGATVTIGSGGTFVITSGSFNKVTLGSNLTVPAVATLTVYQTLNLNGHSLTLAGSNSGAANVFFEDVSGETAGPALTGTGQVIMGGTNPAENSFYAYSSLHPMTIASTVTVEGAGNIYIAYASPGGLTNSGIITANVKGQTLNISSGGTLTNSGTVSATGGGNLTIGSGLANSAGKTISVTGGGILNLSGAWTNAGTISETSSVLDLGGTFSSTGTLTRSSGTVNLTGVYNLKGGTLAFTSTTGSWNVVGGTLQNAVITNSGGAGLLFPSGDYGYFNDVTLGANITITAGATLYVYQTLNLNKFNLILAGASTGASSVFFEDVTGETVGPTLTGGGAVMLAGTTPAENSFYAYSSSKVTTISAGVTVEGAGNIYVGYASPGGLINSGTISANTNGQVLTIGGGGTFSNKSIMQAVSGGILTLTAPWTNTGSIVETSSTVNLGGTFSATGTITRTGGNINLTGVYNLKGGTQTFNTTTGSWNLVGGTLENAVLVQSGGAGIVLGASGYGYFNDVTLGANMTVPAGTSLYIYQTLNLKGFSLLLSGTATGAASVFCEDVSGETTGPIFTGGGAIMLAGTTPTEDNFYAYSSSHPTSIASGVTLEGAGNVYIGYASPGGLSNSGTIAANVSGKILSFSGGGTLTNSSMLTATGGGILTLNGPWVNNGTITETSSTINLGGTFNKVGTLTRTGGTINLTGIYDLKGGTQAFTTTTGSWNLMGGTLANAVMTNTGGAGLVLPTSGYGYFNDVTLGANFTIPATASLYLYQTLNLKGFTLILSGSASGASSLFCEDVSGESVGPTLSGGGAVMLTGTAAEDNFYAYSSTKAMTISSGTTVEGFGNIYVGYASPGGLVNSGTLAANISGQTLNLGGGGAFTNHGTISVSTGANLNITLPSNSISSSGNITGTGTITGNVTNTGVITPGAPSGVLTIKGNFTQTSTGAIKVELGGTTSTTYNRLTVTGTATLAGILDIYEINSFKPAVGNSFTVLSYASKTGTIGTDGSSLSSTVSLAATIGTTSTVLKGITPSPADTTAPKVSSFKASTPVSGGTTLTITVTYTDNVAINVASLLTGNIKVVGPNSYSAVATFVSVNKTNNGTPRTATYSIPAPGGKWDKTDNGTYTISLLASSVKDSSGNAAVAATIGTFVVNLAT